LALVVVLLWNELVTGTKIQKAVIVAEPLAKPADKLSLRVLACEDP
jgi:hypothetical protein